MRVSLFVSCLVDLFFPEVGESTVKVLEGQGLKVDFPRNQTCCGQPAFNSGYWHDAKKAGHHFLEVFDETSDYIVTPSGSCAMMVKKEYPHLFEDEPDTKTRANALADRVFELSSFLTDVLGIEKFDTRYDGRMTYHASCHLSRGLGVVEPPRNLLKSVDGAEYVEMQDAGRCCGFGGTFAVKLAHVSNAMVEDKIAAIRESGADTLVSCDAGCLMQITGAMRRSDPDLKAYHIAQILAGDTEE